MGAFFEEIPANQVDWILTQKIFWVSTAPLSGSGHINISPKGGASREYFGVPNTKSFWFIDMSGSGIETISHLLEPGNGRITILFNSFEGSPRIIRLWGKGKVLEYGTPGYNEIVARENIVPKPGIRSIITVDIDQAGTSCGFQVPFYSFVGYRHILEDHLRKKAERFEQGHEEESMDRYWAFKNAYSMDGLPGMKRALKAGKEYSIEPIKKMVGKAAPKKGVMANADMNIAYMVIALLVVFIAILAATHPAFEYFPAQRRMQDLLLQVTSAPRGSPSASQRLSQ
ncbi:pyridoxamine phosphate oxidase family protein [Xylaria intraflava]|nr:pyridoxamine phosphate oxidase family protein [Xylaria intraflava]